MRILTGTLLTAAICVAAAIAMAQRPGPGGPGADQAPPEDDLVARMMTFDTEKDGKLTKAEVTDERLHGLFDRADANKDGVVTKEELNALAIREQSSSRGGPPGFGPPPGGGPGGPGGPGMGPPPRPGEILPAMVRQRLNLTATQEKQIAELQKDVDSKLQEILTDEQRTQLRNMRNRGPGGFGPPGRGGRRGGGPPPGPPDQSF